MVAVPLPFLVKTDAVKSLSCLIFIFLLHKFYGFYINNHLDNYRDDKHQKKLVNILL